MPCQMFDFFLRRTRIMKHSVLKSFLELDFSKKKKPCLKDFQSPDFLEQIQVVRVIVVREIDD